MPSKQLILRILYENRMILIYAGLFVFGLLMIWYLTGINKPQEENFDPTPDPYYQQ